MRETLHGASPTSGWDVFLSYSTKDTRAATRIAADLRASGLTVWHDVAHIAAGARIREAIHTGIRNSRVFLLLVSRNSLKSRWVLNELDAAMMQEISTRRDTVLPLLIGRIDPNDLPSDIVGKRFIDLRHNFEAKYSAKRLYLTHAVRFLAGKGPATNENSVRLVPDFLNRILAHHYDGSRETSEEVRRSFTEKADGMLKLLPRLVSISDKSQQATIEKAFNTTVKQCRDEFVRTYGSFAARQLVHYIYDYTGISFSGGFTSDQLYSVVSTLRVLLFMFHLRNELVREQGLDIAVLLVDPKRMEFQVVKAITP